MRRLAFLTAAVLAVAAAPSVRAEPLDLDLARLGPPTAAGWEEFVGTTVGTAAAYARSSRQRFGVLSAEMALALSSAVLQPASTTGHSGFAVDLEIATMAVHPDPIGVSTAGFASRAWPTESAPPTQLYLPSLHVRKALPFSFELGGRLIYLASSSFFAAQGEAKWAFNEGLEYVPDLAVRVAYTRLFGQRDWDLSATDIDFLVSRRWGLGGVTSLTPYLVARYTRVSASSERIEFAPLRAAGDPAALVTTQAAFPRFTLGVYRTTLGVRFTAYTVSMAVEGTYFGGASASGSDYEGVKIASSLGGAAKLGWEF